MTKYCHPNKHTPAQIARAKRLLQTAPRGPSGRLQNGQLDRIVGLTGVSKPTLSAVNRGRDWTHVEPA